MSQDAPGGPDEPDIDSPDEAPAAGPPSGALLSDELLKLVYDELRLAARRRMQAERADHTLSATALVHEAYLRLIGPCEVPWANRAHFYAAAVQAMQRILVDHARARAADLRAGSGRRIDLGAAGAMSAACENSSDFLALVEAISRLQEVDPRSAEVVRLRYYAGLSAADVAALLGVSKRTVQNDWAFAKAWLQRALAMPD